MAIKSKCAARIRKRSPEFLYFLGNPWEIAPIALAIHPAVEEFLCSVSLGPV